MPYDEYIISAWSQQEVVKCPANEAGAQLSDFREPKPLTSARWMDVCDRWRLQIVDWKCTRLCCILTRMKTGEVCWH
jgi:hypothetical protein